MASPTSNSPAPVEGQQEIVVVTGRQLVDDIRRFCAMELLVISEEAYVFGGDFPNTVNHTDNLYLILRRILILQLKHGQSLVLKHEDTVNDTEPPSDGEDKTPLRVPSQIKNVVRAFVESFGPNAEDEIADVEFVPAEDHSLVRLAARLTAFREAHPELQPEDCDFVTLLCGQEMLDVINGYYPGTEINYIEILQSTTVLYLWLRQLRKLAKEYLESGRAEDGKPLPEKAQVKAILDILPELLTDFVQYIQVGL